MRSSSPRRRRRVSVLVTGVNAYECVFVCGCVRNSPLVALSINPACMPVFLVPHKSPRVVLVVSRIGLAVAPPFPSCS